VPYWLEDEILLLPKDAPKYRQRLDQHRERAERRGITIPRKFSRKVVLLTWDLLTIASVVSYEADREDRAESKR
jgi:hypothetical protein